MLVCLGVASASVYKQNEPVNLSFACFNNGAKCSNSASCNVSIHYPNNSYIVLNQELTPIESNLFYYDLPNSNNLGEYTGILYCVDGSFAYNKDFNFIINSSGEKESSYGVIGALVSIILMTVVYLVAAFKLNDNYFGIKLMLLFMSFANVIASSAFAFVSKSEYYNFDTLLIAMMITNGAVLLYLTYKVIANLLLAHANKLEDEYK